MRAHIRTTKSFVLVLAACIGVLAGPGSAIAHDHEPPRTALRANGERVQRGVLSSYCWTRPGSEPGTHVSYCTGGVSSFPRAKYVQPGTRVTIRVLKSQRPRELSIRAWKRVDVNGFPVGDGEELDYARRRVRVGDRVVWEFSFVLSDSSRHYYLEVFGTWQDEDRVAPQDASWSFHIRTFR